MKKISIYLPEPTLHRIYDEAKYFDLKVGDIIRRRIESGSAYRPARRGRFKSLTAPSEAA